MGLKPIESQISKSQKQNNFQRKPLSQIAHAGRTKPNQKMSSSNNVCGSPSQHHLQVERVISQIKLAQTMFLYNISDFHIYAINYG